jgi:cytochrome P450
MTVANDAEALAYPFPRDSRTDPPAEIARCRGEAPVVQVRLPTGDLAWLVTRHDDIRAVLADPRLSPQYPGFVGAQRQSGAGGSNFMFSKGPADHARLRQIVGWAFTPRYVEGMRPRIQEIADDLLTRMADQSPPVDLVAAYAFPLPVIVIAELLGVPIPDREEFRDIFRAWTAARLATRGQGSGKASDAGQRLRDYVDGMIAAKRRNPGHDLMTALLAAHDEGDDRLSSAELFSMATGLLISGYVTSVNAIARGTLALLRSGQYAALSAGSVGIGQAVEEILRYGQSGDTGVLRIATEGVQIGATMIARGEAVLTPLAAANRDPSYFRDPDRFDITRKDNPHLSFGHGSHHCTGAALARLELQVAFGSLAHAFPALRLAAPEDEAERLVVPFIELPGRGGVLVGGARELLVTW